MLHGLCSAYPCVRVVHEVGRRALLAAVPGEQHTFGISMVAEFFRRAGWDVFAIPPASRAELIDVVRREWLAVVGLSASCERHVDTLTATIRDIRRASRHRSVGVIVGGALFAAHPELVSVVGADATGADGLLATAHAERLLPAEARVN
jgi:methanogenic corrinoid protein MtbC1